MKTKYFLILFLCMCCCDIYAMNYRGIVYDVGLQYNPGQYSVENFNEHLVRYDLGVIADSLHCNAVRIEGEDLVRLEAASEIASEFGLKVFFNPWMMNANAEEVFAYMEKAAKVAERLRKKGVDITFVAGCEFSLFNKGIFDGNSPTERINSMIEQHSKLKNAQQLQNFNNEFMKKLNTILGKIVKGVRKSFKGDVTYSAGTWEPVAWTMFDTIGVDYYRDKQTEEEYVSGLKKYLQYEKPVWVMEVGCCAFEGASALGGGGFSVCQGTDENGNGIYTDGRVPIRFEKEQADYAETQIRLLKDSGIEGMFIFEFSFPIAPYRESGHDADMTAYPIVKSFPKDDPRSDMMPPWQPKEAFHRVASVYKEIADK